VIAYGLCHEGEGDAGEDIAAAGRSHARVATRRDKRLALRCKDGGAVRLLDDDEVVHDAHILRFHVAEESLVLAGMRSDDGAANHIHPFRVQGNDIERIGIEDKRLVGVRGAILQQTEESLLSALVGADAGAYGYGVVAVEMLWHRGEEAVVIVDGEHSLWHGDLKDVDATARHVDGEEADAAVEACRCGEAGCAHLAVAAGDEEGVAVVALVAFRLTVEEEGEIRLVLLRNHDDDRKRGMPA